MGTQDEWEHKNLPKLFLIQFLSLGDFPKVGEWIQHGSPQIQFSKMPIGLLWN